VGALRRSETALRALDPVVLGAAVVTLLAAWTSVRLGAQLSLAGVVGIGCFIAIFLAFLGAPHVAVAITVVVFALIPALKVFVSPFMGSLKDLDTTAATAAAVVVGIFGRRRLDRTALGLVLLILTLYAVNAGGGHGIAWAQGVRLVGEPLLLLLVGMVLPNARRNLRYGSMALVAVAAFAATYGLLQQAVGPGVLVSWGYEYNEQVRTIGSSMRSFGTLDDPFAYAALLLFGIAGVLFLTRRGLWSAGLLALLLAGLTVSFVRTALLIFAGFAALAIARRGSAIPAVLVAVASVLAGLTVLLGGASATETRSFTVATPTGSELTSRPGVTNVVLNGRVSAWTAALGDQPLEWVFGRGVGEVGTAADRAGFAFAPPEDGAAVAKSSLAVDSGYLAAVADVGALGLAVLVTLFARLAWLLWAGARRGNNAGWFGLAILFGFLLDALTRASFTGFPTAFLAMLFVGMAVSAVQDDGDEQRPSDADVIAVPSEHRALA
jgi:hypothetical protein